MDSAEFSAGSNRARKDAQKLGETIQRNLGVGIDRATTALKGFAGAYLSLEGAKKFLEYADAAKSMDAQLRLATASFGTFNKAQADVNRIATVTRGGLAETTSLYGNFIRASAVLGKTQDEAARATETFSKALTIGGADANEAASATLQFGQALASGVLRGDEFNSIAEASPRILTLLADSLGVTSGSLRAMAADGKLTADVLYKALTDRKFTAGIDAEFGQLPVTFGQAMTLVNNAAIETFGAFDRGGGFSTALANFVTDGASGFADLAKSAEQFGIDTRAVFAGLDNLFDPIGANGNAIFDALGIKVYSLGEQIRSLLASVDQLRNIPIDAQNAANAFDRRVFGTQFRSDQQRSNLAGSYDQGSRRSKARSRLDQSVRRLEGNGYIVPRNADGTVNEAGIRRRPTAPRPAAAPKAAGSGGKSGSSDADKAENERKRAAEKARRDEAAYEQDLSRAQSEQLQAQLDLTVDQTERVNIQQEILRQEQAGRIAAIANDQHLTDEQKAQLTLMEQKTGALKNDLLHREDVDRINRQALERAQAQSDNETDILSAQAQLARTAKERGEIERQILDQQFEMLKLVQQAALDEANRKGDKQGADLATQRLGTLDQLQKLGQDRVARDNQGPLASYLDGIPKTVAETNEAFESIATNGIGSLIDGLSQARGGFKSLAQVVSSVSNEIISSLLKITLQKSFASLFGSVLGGGGIGKYASPFVGGGSSFVADSSGLPSLAGYRADGGSVIGGKSYVVGEMGPEIFTAPHSGSIIANDDISRADNRGGVMEVRLRDELLDARIISGSSRVTQAGIAQDKQQQSKFASRRLGR